MSASVPFRVQNWQDTIDWPHSEDHSYHGMRRGVIEYQLQVPKQLDSKRLQDLQFGFQASWRTEQDAIKVKEIEYYIIEEEQQLFMSMASPVISSTVISTSAIHDCSGYSVSTNDWSEMRAAARLQIPQPNTVQERTALPVPNTLSIEHKLRILIRFDQTLSKERDLQLSFAIRIHPTLEEDGSPVHPGAHITQRSQRRRRRRQSALYGFDTRGLGDLGSEDGESDDEHFPLPMYADREGTLLLMVGEESPEGSGLVAGQIEPSGISMTRSFADGITMQTPSETLISSQHNSPLSSNDLPSFPMGNMPVQGEQHAWTVINRRYSLVPPSSEQMAHPGSRTLRRHSSFYARSNGGDQPPPYVLPPMAEESLRSYISSTHGSGSEVPPVLPAAQVSRGDQLGSPARPSTSVNPLPSPPYEIHEEPLSFRMGARVGDQSFASRSSPPSSSSRPSPPSPSSASPSSSLPSPTPYNTNPNSRQTPNTNSRQPPNTNSPQPPSTNSRQRSNTNPRQTSNTNPRQTSNASHSFRLVDMLTSGVGGGDSFAYSPGNW
ncbi:hypothetical protein BGZ98_001524 [Dissophora globulifera]|nr:hypothetical protein BGZ98_001524 [Dissophora globulifera]